MIKASLFLPLQLHNELRSTKCTRKIFRRQTTVCSFYGLHHDSNHELFRPSTAICREKTTKQINCRIYRFLIAIKYRLASFCTSVWVGHQSYVQNFCQILTEWIRSHELTDNLKAFNRYNGIDSLRVGTDSIWEVCACGCLCKLIANNVIFAVGAANAYELDNNDYQCY